MQSEGHEEIIKYLVHKSIDHPEIKNIQKKIIPVIRGSEWPNKIITSVEERLKKDGHKLIFFQGTQSILR